MNVKIVRKLYTRYISANWFVGHRNGSSSVIVFMKPFDDDDAITSCFFFSCLYRTEIIHVNTAPHIVP